MIVAGRDTNKGKKEVRMAFIVWILSLIAICGLLYSVIVEIGKVWGEREGDMEESKD